MLHNIKLRANEVTEIAKQGKFINVVLAAGEIEVTLRMSDDSNFKTKLVSGMSFPVPSGFKSAAFVSDITQQTKVWLGDLPLTYSPIEQKVVGSSAIQSLQKSVFFSSPVEILPARNGRGKVTMQANSDWKVGGEGISLTNSLTVPAGELREFATQGAVYAYSLDPNDRPLTYAKMQTPLQEGRKSSFNYSGDTVIHNEITDELIVLGNRAAFRMDLHNLDAVVQLNTGIGTVNTHTIIDREESFVIFGDFGGEIVAREISKINYDVLSTTTLVANPTGATIRWLAITKTAFALGTATGGTAMYTGLLDGSATVEVDTAGIVNSNISNGILSDANELVVFDAAKSYYAITEDNGATWENKNEISLAASLAGGVTVDVATGAVWALSTNFVLFKSSDFCRTWEAVPIGSEVVNAGGMSTVKVVNGNIYTGGTYSFSYYNAQEDKWYWLDFDFSYFRPSGMGFSKIGTAYVMGSGSFRFMELGGTVAEAGGLAIKILEETN